jgi:hypothetical protein
MNATQKMNTPTKTGGYDVGRPGGVCAKCGTALAPNTKLTAVLRESAAGFERVDICQACWPDYDRTDSVAFWQTVVPNPEAKKKIFVDDEVLCDLFLRLQDAAEPAKLNFRFVLGLILMRKRLVIYQSSRTENGHDVWIVKLKGRDEPVEMFDPKLTEQQVGDVSRQLSEILSEGA